MLLYWSGATNKTPSSLSKPIYSSLTSSIFTFPYNWNSSVDTDHAVWVGTYQTEGKQKNNTRIWNNPQHISNPTYDDTDRFSYPDNIIAPLPKDVTHYSESVPDIAYTKSYNTTTLSGSDFPYSTSQTIDPVIGLSVKITPRPSFKFNSISYNLEYIISANGSIKGTFNDPVNPLNDTANLPDGIIYNYSTKQNVDLVTTFGGVALNNGVPVKYPSITLPATGIDEFMVQGLSCLFINNPTDKSVWDFKFNDTVIKSTIFNNGWAVKPISINKNTTFNIKITNIKLNYSKI